MFDWIETYGYPKDMFTGKQYRFSLGWFFIGLDKDEPACYMDFYFIDSNKAVMILDYFHSAIEINMFEPVDGIECPQCEDVDTIVVRNKIFKHFEGKCRTCGKAWVIEKPYKNKEEKICL